MSGPAARAARQLIQPLRDFFAAMLFAFFDLSVDPSQLPPALGTAAVLAVVTTCTKFVGGWIIGRRAGLVPRARARTGALLVARGEFSIVIALIAVASGLEFVGPVAIGYVLILVVAGPVVARFVDPGWASWKRVAAGLEHERRCRRRWYRMVRPFRGQAAQRSRTNQSAVLPLGEIAPISECTGKWPELTGSPAS
jgi:K+:H+ antiporter subunit KhtU